MCAIGEGTRNVSPGSIRQCSPIWRISAWSELWRVQNALGPAGGAGGVHDHPHRVGIERRQRRGRRRRRTGRRTRCGGRRRRAPRRPRAASHRRRSRGRASRRSRGRGSRAGTKIIRLSASARMKRSSWSRSDGRIGLTTMPASVAREVDDRGLVPVGQHERHHAAGGHPRRASACGQRRRPASSRLAAGQSNVAVDAARFGPGCRGAASRSASASVVSTHSPRA